jgi:hypothetical protein
MVLKGVQGGQTVAYEEVVYMRILLYIVLAIGVTVGLQLLLGSTSWLASIFGAFLVVAAVGGIFAVRRRQSTG